MGAQALESTHERVKTGSNGFVPNWAVEPIRATVPIKRIAPIRAAIPPAEQLRPKEQRARDPPARPLAHAGTNSRAHRLSLSRPPARSRVHTGAAPHACPELHEMDFAPEKDPSSAPECALWTLRQNACRHLGRPHDRPAPNGATRTSEMPQKRRYVRPWPLPECRNTAGGLARLTSPPVTKYRSRIPGHSKPLILAQSPQRHFRGSPPFATASLMTAPLAATPSAATSFADVPFAATPLAAARKRSLRAQTRASATAAERYSNTSSSERLGT